MTIKPFCRKANFYETDQMGIIHHSNYIKWFEEARVDFLDQLNFEYKKVNNFDIDFALLDVYCEYKLMVYFGDIVNIHVSISEITEMRMTIEYKIIDAKSGGICTLGKTKHFFYNNKKKRPVSLKREIPELYEIFLSIKTADE